MEEDWFLYCLTLFTFIVIFALCYIRYLFTYFDRIKIKTVSQPSFPFGNTYDVFSRKLPFFMQLWKYYNKMKRKNCKFGGFYIFFKPAIVVSDPEIIKTILNDSDIFENVNDEVKCNFSGELSEEILQIFINNYGKSVEKFTENMENGDVNISKLLQEHKINYCGQNIFALDDIENKKLIKLLSNQDSDFARLLTALFAKYSKFFLSGEKHSQFYVPLLDHILMKRKKNDEKIGDIIDCLHNCNSSPSDIANNLFEIAANLRIATNLTLLALYELSSNEEIQEDLRGEICRFRKNKVTYGVADLHTLSYLETVIRETLRKYPIKTYICKIPSEDFMGIPKNTPIFIPIFGIQHDSHNYVNAELFDPDRFAEENEKFLDPTKYLPFGVNSKNNFKARFVSLLMKITLIEFVSKMKFSLGKRSPKLLKFDEVSVQLKLKDSIWLKIDGKC